MSDDQGRVGRSGALEQSNIGGINVAVTGVVGAITIGQTVYAVVGFPEPPPPMVSASGPPSQLLAAHRQVVEFTGREQELTELAAWRDDPTVDWGVRLLHAPGGQGKTRLAAQFAAESTATGWRVVQARHASGPGLAQGLAGGMPKLPADARGLLVVVDYAERWPGSHLLLALTDALLRQAAVVRVLLLARPAGSWWQGLRHELRKLGAVATAVPLKAVADTIEQREKVFVAARNRFSQLLEADETEGIPPPPELGTAAFDTVLALHMAAVVTVDAAKRGTEPPADAVGLSAYLLDRERAYWQSLSDNGRSMTGPAVMARAVYVATMTGALARKQAVAALKRADVAQGGDPTVVIDDHRLCYPPIDASTVLEPLYPDRLGEDFIALQTPGHSHMTDFEPDDWAANAARDLLVPVDGQPASWARPGVTMLAEAGRRWPHLVEQVLYPLLHAHPSLALVAGNVVLPILADLPNTDLDLLNTVAAQLPLHRQVDLDLGIAAVLLRITRQTVVAAGLATRAHLLDTLAVRLSYAGQRTEAHAAAREAVEVFRMLAAANPSAFQSRLATSLDNYGVALSELGRREEALAATSEAVDMYQQLVTATPDAFVPNLATALSNLGVRLSELERRVEALIPLTRVVEIRRQLAADRPDGFEPGLALALSNLGAGLAALGQREEALTPAREAVEICRRLAENSPGVFEPDLAVSLSNLGVRLSELGQHEEALAATGEVVEIYRRLVTINSNAFEPDLAATQYGLGAALLRLGHREQALGRWEQAFDRLTEAFAATREAVEIYRRLEVTSSGVFESDLARSLNTLANALSSLGWRKEALIASREALEIYRRLVANGSDILSADLAAALVNFGADMLERGEEVPGRREEALAATGEGVEIYRRLIAANPGGFESKLAISLSNLGAGLAALGRREEALAVTGEAVEIYRRLAEKSPSLFEHDLAGSLHTHSLGLSSLGWREEALAATGEAVEIYRRLAEKSPGAFEHDLAGSLSNLGAWLSGLGWREEALAATGEAVEIYRRLAEKGPVAFESYLAASMYNLGMELSALGRQEDALAATDEVVEICRRLAPGRPDMFGQMLGVATARLADLLDQLGHDERATQVRLSIDRKAQR